MLARRIGQTGSGIQVALAVMTGDCLPLLISDRAGSEVAAVHAGWRGLLAGVIEATVNCFQSPSDELVVWFGPAICRARH